MPKKVFVTDNNVAGKFFIYFSCKVTQRNYKIVYNIHVALLKGLEYSLSYLSATCGNG